MATLSFSGETQGEIVTKVRRWLASLEGSPEGQMSRTEAIEAGADITKDALRVIASSAPGPVAQSDLVKGLTSMGYKLTDATKTAIFSGLDSLEEVTGGSVVRQVSKVGANAMYEMNSAIARQILRSVKGR